MTTERVSIDRLRRDTENRNRGTERGRRAVKESLEQFGAARSVVLDKHGNVIAGNTTVAAAIEAGIEEVLVVQTTGDALIAHQRTDLDLKEKRGAARALSIADNVTGALGYYLDFSRVAEDLKHGLPLPEAILHPGEIDDLIRRQAELGSPLPPEFEPHQTFGGLAEGVDPDALPEDVRLRCAPGDRWALGPHRLAIGSSAEPEVVAALLADGDPIRCVWTDPPYGVAYEGGTQERLTIENDDLDAEGTRRLCATALRLAATACARGAALYVACPSATPLPHFIGAVQESGFQYRHSLVWVKDQFVLGRCDYHYRHETILYGWLPGAHYFVDERTHDSVFEVPRPRVSDQHPTMKPVELVTRMLRNSSREGETIYDPFTGSGSTLLACEATGRLFRGCELDPRYGDVILARWETATGRSAERTA